MAKAMRKTPRPMKDSTGHGFEPAENQVFESSNDVAYSDALNWYSWHQSQDKFRKEAWEWLATYLKSQKYSAKDISAIKRSGFKHLGNPEFSMARMMTRGCTLPEESIARFWERVRAALEHGETIREEIVEKITSKDSRSPAQRNFDTAMGYRADLDELFDKVWEDKLAVEDINFFDLFTKLSVKPLQAGILAKHYMAELEEMRLLRDPKFCRDNDISFRNGPIEKNLLRFAEERQKALQGWALGRSQLKKIVTKPSKRKIANVSTLKFKPSDETLKLTSIDPNAILGASLLVMYNTKYRQLTILRAASDEGLSIKGTTILNVDEKNSETKRAGNEKATIHEMASSSKTQIAKLFASISSQPIDIRTRTSEEVLLVRALK